MNKKKYLKAGDLFEKIANKSNYTDPGIVAEVYYGLLKAITEELRSGNAVRLPELGDFYLQKRKNMTTYMFKTGGIHRRESIKVVKFSACANIGKYFNAID